jgi:hypothetical protein
MRETKSCDKLQDFVSLFTPKIYEKTPDPYFYSWLFISLFIPAGAGFDG